MREKNNDCENYIPQKLTPCGKETCLQYCWKLFGFKNNCSLEKSKKGEKPSKSQKQKNKTREVTNKKA